MKRVAGFTICVALLGLAGCHTMPARPSVLPPPLPPGADAILSPADAEAGRKLYINKCARCHRFYEPAKYAAGEWETWMLKMSRKAKLKPAQEELLARYLGLFRRPTGVPPSVAERE